MEEPSATTIKDRENFSRITEHLYIGAARNITDHNLQRYKITHIVNATVTVPLKTNYSSLRVNVNFDFVQLSTKGIFFARRFWIQTRNPSFLISTLSRTIFTMQSKTMAMWSYTVSRASVGPLPL